MIRSASVAVSTAFFLVVCAVFSYASPLPNTIPAPADNPTTPAKVALGKQLFFDPRLSSTGVISCNSCHNVMGGGTDNREVSMGVKGHLGSRSAPTVWNAALKPSQFWDGRALTLEAQAEGPPLNPVEMGNKNAAAIETTLRAIPGYVREFTAVFGPHSVTFGNMAKAIAAYERTLITRNSPYDRFMQGDKTAMNPAAVRGLDTFNRLGCATCHSGPDFAGSTPVGTPFRQKFPVYANNPYVMKYGFLKDKGYYDTTHKEADLHLYQVPTLRNIALTAPYFSNGAVKTLPEAVRVMAAVQLNKSLSDRQVMDIVAFLDDLTGQFPKQSLPHLPQTPGKSVILDQH